MRGKSVQLAEHWVLVDAASMRPAHYAREVPPERREQPPVPPEASMRPAHYAREVLPAAVAPDHDVAASMRPAHYAREVAALAAHWEELSPQLQ